MIVNRLDWDSEFFGLRIGHAVISSKEDASELAGQSRLLKRDFDLVYVFGSHGLDFSAVNAKLVDKKVVYIQSGNPCSEMDNNVVMWDSNRGVTEDLLHLALVSGKYSRFRLDDGFPKGSFERLYFRWIEQSVKFTMASEVFCYMIGSVPRGLITLNNKNGNGTIGLVAIHEDFQHRGIGSTMMRHVIQYSIENRINKLTVATQLDNIPACQLYEKSGFLVKSITDVWHWWL